MMSDEAGKLEFQKSYAIMQKKIVEKGEWLKLGVVERMILLILPTLVDDHGCMRLSSKTIRASVFPETGMSLWRIDLAVRKLAKLGFICLYRTNCGMNVLYARFIVEMLPSITNRKPTLPLPPQIDWYNDVSGEFRIVHFG